MTKIANTRAVSAPALSRWIAEVFIACGVAPGDAATAASVLTRTTLRGSLTHGVTRVLDYVEQLHAGKIKAQPRFAAELRDGALRCDCDLGLGQAVAMRAVREAVAQACNTAAIVCLIRNCGHLDALGPYALDAAEHGMIALLCKETPPLMTLAGGTKPAIGNNPIAFAAPVAGKAPLMFDMATSVTSRMRIRKAARDKISIPDDWAIGPDGAPTDDPATALAGALSPIAGHKGIGLAMMAQCLAGSLVDAPTGSGGGGNIFALIVNPERMVGRAVYDAQVAGWLGRYLDATGAQARYPGQRAAECEREWGRTGLPLPDSVLRDFARAGELAGALFDLARLAA